MGIGTVADAQRRLGASDWALIAADVAIVFLAARCGRPTSPRWPPWYARWEL
jgi:hypothetical protein